MSTSQAGVVDLVDRPGKIEAEDRRAVAQPRAVLGELEHLAAIGALPLEHRGGIVQPVGQDVDVRLAPRHQVAVVPDPPVAIVVRLNVGHLHPVSKLSFAR